MPHKCAAPPNHQCYAIVNVGSEYHCANGGMTGPPNYNSCKWYGGFAPPRRAPSASVWTANQRKTLMARNTMIAHMSTEELENMYDNPPELQVAQPEKKDLRIVPRYPNDEIFQQCKAMRVDSDEQQSDCKYFCKGTNKNRCMYQKWDSMSICDKLILKDDTEVN